MKKLFALMIFLGMPGLFASASVLSDFCGSSSYQRFVLIPAFTISASEDFIDNTTGRRGKGSMVGYQFRTLVSLTNLTSLTQTVHVGFLNYQHAAGVNGAAQAPFSSWNPTDVSGNYVSGSYDLNPPPDGLSSSDKTISSGATVSFKFSTFCEVANNMGKRSKCSSTDPFGSFTPSARNVESQWSSRVTTAIVVCVQDVTGALAGSAQIELNLNSRAQAGSTTDGNNDDVTQTKDLNGGRPF